MPTDGAKRAHMKLVDDAESVRAEIVRLSDDGRDVILVMHSYGGLPGSQVHTQLCMSRPLYDRVPTWNLVRCAQDR